MYFYSRNRNRFTAYICLFCNVFFYLTSIN
nr:MAG TPA: hypothetical protein [Caudoviricetes sp.]